MASAAAHRLFRSGFQVIMTEVENLNGAKTGILRKLRI